MITLTCMSMSGRRSGRAFTRLSWRVTLVLVSLIFFSSSICTGADSTSGTLSSTDVWIRVNPSVLWCGAYDSMATLEVHIVGRADVVGITVVGPNETLVLYDDGTHGDVLASDFTFTLAGVRPFCHTGLSLKYGGTIGSWSGTIEAILSDGTTLVAERRVAIGLAQPRYRKSVDVVYYPNGISATAHAFFIQDIDGTIFDGYPVSTTAPRVACCRALQTLYSVLPDAFDLAVVMPGRAMFSGDGFSELALETIRTANDVEHIGIPIYNDARSCGSGGRLRGAIFNPFGSIDSLDSEILNIWGASVGAPFGLTQVTDTGSPYWDPYSDVGGQLASYLVAVDGTVGNLAPNGDGTWRLVSLADNPTYAPLELYIMGLLAADDVPAVHVLSGLDLADSQRITAAAVETIMMEDMVAAQGGVRSPTPKDSPKVFSVAFVVVQDEPFTEAEVAYYSLLSYHLASQDAPGDFDLYAPFFWATGGRAALDSRLPLDVKPIIPR